MPRHSAPSNTLCDSATAVAIAITSRENSDSSMPLWPWVTPSHIAGTPPANCAIAPALRAASLINGGKCSNGWCADNMSLYAETIARFGQPLPRSAVLSSDGEAAMACARLVHETRPWAEGSEEHTSELQSLMRISFA